MKGPHLPYVGLLGKREKEFRQPLGANTSPWLTTGKDTGISIL